MKLFALYLSSRRKTVNKNVDYHIAKLDEMVKKFANLTVESAKQESLLL